MFEDGQADTLDVMERRLHQHTERLDRERRRRERKQQEEGNDKPEPELGLRVKR